jgi:hypothetical protein
MTTPTEYDSLPSFAQFFIHALRNSIGDITVPDYAKWTLMASQNKFAYSMIYLLWIMFIMQEYFMMILLLNFLIALISQSFEETRSTEVNNTLDQKA